jgi:hypothetical protein
VVQVRASLALVAVSVLMLVLGACTQTPQGLASPAASTAPPSAGASGPSPDGGSAGPDGSAGSAGASVWLPDWADDTAVPPEVADREPVRFCGLEKAPAAAPVEHIDAVVRKCFWDVWLAGGSAEFASVQTTMEGDPVASVYRLPGDGSIVILTDGSQDRFGSGGWTLTRCGELVEDTEGRAFFGAADCDEGELLE